MQAYSTLKIKLVMLSIASLFAACQSARDVTTQTEARVRQITDVRARLTSGAGTIFGNTIPQIPAWPDFEPVTLGVKFKSSLAGTISGIRLYRGITGPTTLKVTLWTEAGAALATGTLSLPNGVTQAGWLEVPFLQANGTPVDVPITANTVYVASYYTPTGQYAAQNEGLAADVSNANGFGGTLTALGGVTNGGNGVYVYNNPDQFPTQSFRNTNYFVDVLFSTYSTIFGNVTPAIAAWPDNEAVTLGVKFSSSLDGAISGVRVYRGLTAAVTLRATLWSNTGTALAEGTLDFPAGVTQAGWYEIPFRAADGSPVKVPITANTTYVASYHTPIGQYAALNEGLATDVASPNGFGGTITALGGIANDGNGVYRYGPAGQFPSQSFRNTNYYVDVLFN